MAHDSVLEYWYQALRARFGIAVRSNRPDALCQKLYAARRDACDVDLEAVSIIRSPSDPAVLWLTKKAP